MDLLDNTIQPYAWGSHTAIADLLGRSTPSPGPEAELWMGAHPAGPSRVERDGRERPLGEVIALDPAAELGPTCLARFGGSLPFLFKVIAADAALSIQVHPSRDQAEAGYEAENNAGIPEKAPNRNYRDNWPKPEMLCALTPFEALAGLRSAAEAADVLDGLGVAALSSYTAGLRAEPTPEAVAHVLGSLLGSPATQVADLVRDVVDAAKRASDAGGPHVDAYRVVLDLQDDHPDDIGVVCSLLLRHVVLDPGQTMFMPAGGLHAYVRGVGVELMANSDNVLRAGLTRKHIDVPELLRVLDPRAEVPIIEPRHGPTGVDVFEVPVPEIRLARLTPYGDAVEAPANGPRILLCVEGSTVVRTGRQTQTLDRGGSCYVPAGDGPLSVLGNGTVFQAYPGIE